MAEIKTKDSFAPKTSIRRSWYIKLVSLMLSLALVVSQGMICSAEAVPDSSEDDASLPIYLEEQYADRQDTYDKYKNALENIPAASQDIVLSLDAFDDAQEMIDGRNGILLDGSNVRTTATFTVETEGVYELEFQWYTVAGYSQPTQIAVLFDGEAPFREALNVKLPRMWKDIEGIVTDEATGNQYSPRQVECLGWQVERLKNRTGEYQGSYRFHLTAGEHTISFVGLLGEIYFGGCAFRPIEDTPTFEEYRENHGEPTPSTESFSTTIEAETAIRKSTQSLSPSEDRSSPLNTPIHLTQSRVNVIGLNWTTAGEWIEWEIEVPADGYYQMYFRYLQNTTYGLPSNRILTIDGVVPFAEAGAIPFAYSENWSVTGLPGANGEDGYVWLTKGTHVMRLEATTAEISEVVRSVNQVLVNLNDLYKDIVMVTSVNPDTYTDYNLHLVIDGLQERLKENAELLKKAYNAVNEYSSHKGNQAEQLNRFAVQLEDFVEKPATITRRLASFKDNISTLSAWLMNIRQQPLVLDSFTICSVGEESPYQKESFWKKLWFDLKAFVLSFFADYTFFGSVKSEESISMWLNVGRDQAKVFKTLVDDMFTAETGIGVDIKLTGAGITEARLSGNTPDVAIWYGRSAPVNYGARGALMALNDFEGFDEIAERFHPGSLDPLYYEGKCYGLPDSQSFSMMFYRRDILNQLGITPPETWDDLLPIANTLQKNHMMVALPYSAISAATIDAGAVASGLFATLLLQRGGKIYSDDLTKTAFLEKDAQEAFVQWTNFYTLYGLPLTYDLLNRFRTGEIPIAIADYTFYNTLQVGAPEVEGLWKMAPIPGTRQEDGTINRTQASAGTTCVILDGCQNPELAWKFLCFWTSEDAQLRYMTDIEAAIGTSARYASSNVNAVKRYGWSASELEALTTQWSYVKDIPEVVGAYYVSFGLDNAFREVVYEARNPREALSIWDLTINEELLRKRKEIQNAADK